MPEYPDVLVPVQPGLLMPHAQDMQQFMQHYAMLHTPATQGHHLHPALPPYRAEASGSWQDVHVTALPTPLHKLDTCPALDIIHSSPHHLPLPLGEVF